ncbi:hypothetical protein CDAR_550831 [Caerostris darwini]|uniref:Uncharacterized protein n=1 Tax=Caerostris darwini TaxID=1538125 RepID=A0AAV4QNX7_9ARAC|nr:hypothetical protein CDAR_550831 [Caerostris darwini]
MRHYYAETHDCRYRVSTCQKEKSPHTSMIDATFLTTLGSLMSRRLDFGINDSDDSSTNWKCSGNRGRERDGKSGGWSRKKSGFSQSPEGSQPNQPLGCFTVLLSLQISKENIAQNTVLSLSLSLRKGFYSRGWLYCGECRGDKRLCLKERGGMGGECRKRVLVVGDRPESVVVQSTQNARASQLSGLIFRAYCNGGSVFEPLGLREGQALVYITFLFWLGGSSMKGERVNEFSASYACRVAFFSLGECRKSSWCVWRGKQVSRVNA